MGWWWWWFVVCGRANFVDEWMNGWVARRVIFYLPSVADDSSCLFCIAVCSPRKPTRYYARQPMIREDGERAAVILPRSCMPTLDQDPGSQVAKKENWWRKTGGRQRRDRQSPPSGSPICSYFKKPSLRVARVIPDLSRKFAAMRVPRSQNARPRLTSSRARCSREVSST